MVDAWNCGDELAGDWEAFFSGGSLLGKDGDEEDEGILNGTNGIMTSEI